MNELIRGSQDPKEAKNAESQGMLMAKKYFENKRNMDHALFIQDITETVRFWTTLGKRMKINSYMMQLYTGIYSLMTKKYRKVHEVMNKHLATIYTISLFFQIDSKAKNDKDTKSFEENLKAQISNYYEHRKSTHRFLDHILQFAYMIMRLDIQQVINDKTLLRTLLSHITFSHDISVVANDIESIEHYMLGKESYGDIFEHFEQTQTQISRENQMYVNDLEETGELCYAYESLKDAMSRAKTVSTILIEIFREKAKFLLVYQKYHPLAAQKAALAMMHVVKQVLINYPVTNFDHVRTILEDLEVYRRWPFPVGKCANELLDIGFQDFRSPYTNFMFKIREEIPAVDFFSLDKSHGHPVSMKVHGIFEYNSVFEQIMRINQLEHECCDKMNPHSLRSLIILLIIKANIPDLSDKFIEHFCSINPLTIFGIYCSIMSITDKIDDLISVKDVHDLMLKTMEGVKQDIEDTTSQEEETFNMNLHLFLQKGFPWLPKIFHYQFSPWNQQGSDESFPGSSGQFISVENSLSIALGEQKRLKMPLHEKPLKILIYGSSNELSCLVNGLGFLYRADPSLVINSDIRVYYVPTSECSIARYLARHDFWYQRHIYVPFLYPTLEPIPRKTEGGKMPETSKSTLSHRTDPSEDKEIKEEKQLPFLLLERSIQSFCFEAQRVFNVRVYQVECWQQFNINTTTPARFYFCNYVEIGSRVSSHNQKRAQRKTSLVTNLTIRTWSVELNGEIDDDEYSEGAGNIVSLGLYNFPTSDTNYCGADPIPSSEWLELVYIDEESYKSEQKLLSNENIMKKRSETEIKAARSALYTNLHVHTCEIISKKGSFDLEVDQNYRGNYCYIKVSPVWGMENKTHFLSVPFMTFTPLNL